MCPSCGSSNQAEFPTEMLVHFGGLKNLDKPCVWMYPRLLVCLECGFARTTVPATELAQLAAGTPTVEPPAGIPEFDESLGLILGGE
jgi:hypothetical protein